MGRAEVIQTGVADLQRYHQGRRNSCGEGGGAVKELRAMESRKKQKIVTNYACFCIAITLTSKIEVEIIENHSEFYVCAKSCYKYVSSRS